MKPLGIVFEEVEAGSGGAIVVSVLYTPYTLHSYTIHSTPYTLHPTPYTKHPTFYTQHSTLYTLHHTLYKREECVEEGRAC